MITVAQVVLWFSGRSPGRAPGVAPWQNYGRRGQRCAVRPGRGWIDSNDWPEQRGYTEELVDAAGGPSRFVALWQWSRAGSLIDRRLPGWIENVAHRLGFRHAAFYDPILALRARFGSHVRSFDLRDPTVAAAVEADAASLRAYTRDALYWQHEGRPVLYVWALHSGIQNGADVWRRLSARGWYVVGDVQGASSTLAADGLDGVTGFTSAFPGTGQRHLWLDDVLSKLELEWDRWADFPGLVMPATSLQYDDVRLQDEHGGARRATTHLARSREEVRRVALSLRLAARDGYALFGTADNWPEGTTLFRTAGGLRRRFARRDRRGRWRMGHYRGEHLEAIAAASV